MASCGGRTPLERGDVTPAPAREAVELTLESALLEFCTCHHGCGPGVDGTLALRAVNSSDAPVDLTLGELSFQRLDIDGGEVVHPSPGSHLDFPRTQQSYRLEAGASERLDVSVYLDLLDSRDLQPGYYRLQLDVQVGDAPPRPVTLEELSIAFSNVGDPGCGPPG